jgi:hypothetical protein
MGNAGLTPRLFLVLESAMHKGILESVAVVRCSIGALFMGQELVIEGLTIFF